ncbi:SPLICING FACTOR YJU2 [Salix purpurea]|uniref:SPLICING FACTOR YJU2 n=1 Tax=Salix purpurea TaxID=77065 RepID=A0A9Q0TVW7_SALPP|nr:SPLICING FACTOR YJU2 [Salix purpurea]
MDFSLIKTLRARMRSQKKRVAEEEATSKKMGPGIRMLPTTEEDAASAAHVKFSSKFDKNRKDKRALICASFFYGTSNSSMPNKKPFGARTREKENQGTVSSSRHKQNSMTTKRF